MKRAIERGRKKKGRETGKRVRDKEKEKGEKERAKGRKREKKEKREMQRKRRERKQKREKDRAKEKVIEHVSREEKYRKSERKDRLFCLTLLSSLFLFSLCFSPPFFSSLPLFCFSLFSFSLSLVEIYAKCV